MNRLAANVGANRTCPSRSARSPSGSAARPLRWKLSEDRIGQALRSLYRTLARASGASRAPLTPHVSKRLGGMADTAVAYRVEVARQIAIYHRWAPLANGEVEDIVVILNFSGAEQWLPSTSPSTARGPTYSPTRPSRCPGTGATCRSRRTGDGSSGAYELRPPCNGGAGRRDQQARAGSRPPSAPNSGLTTSRRSTSGAGASPVSRCLERASFPSDNHLRARIAPSRLRS